MCWRIGAAWALIGFAAQLLVAAVARQSFQAGLGKALVAYVLWGGAGFLVGLLVERFLNESFQSFAKRQEELEEQEAQRQRESQGADTESTGE